MAHIQLRIEKNDKEDVQEILNSLGLTMSGAIKLFLKQIIRERKLPFNPSLQSQGRFTNQVKGFQTKTIN